MGILRATARPKLSGNYDSANRAALAVAIEELRVFDEDLAKRTDAQPRLEAEHDAAMMARYATEAAASSAATSYATHAVAALLDGSETKPRTPLQAKAREQEARSVYDAADASLTELTAQIEARRATRVWIVDRVTHAAVAVMAESQAVKAVLDRLEKQRRALLPTVAEVVWLAGNDVLKRRNSIACDDTSPEAYTARLIWMVRGDAGPWTDLIEQHPGGIPAMGAAKWAGVMKALRHDVNALVPETV